MLLTQNLRVSAFNRGKGNAEASPLLQNVTIELIKNKITCLIGESGSGKTIFSKAITGLLPKNIIIEAGNIFYNGQDIPYDMLKTLRGRNIFYSPQDASASLNPVIKIKQQINEVSMLDQAQVQDLLTDLDIRDPERVLNSYPFQLSGGENQRCLLAMAVALGPELLILDEPTSALDFHLQEGFLESIKKIQERFGLTILLITHNLLHIRRAAGYVYIILNGEIIEEGTPFELLANPKHNYTKEIAGFSNNSKI